MKSHGEIAQKVSNDLISAALYHDKPETLLEVLCDGLVEEGFPLARCHVATKWLHPMTLATSITWIKGSGVVDRARHEYGTEQNEDWQKSPLKAMIDDRCLDFHMKIENGEGVNRFPLLRQLREADITDYFAMMIPYSENPENFDNLNGIMASFASDVKGGFSEEDIEVLRRLAPRFAVGLKCAFQKETLENVVSAYLGSSATDQVLAGRIRRGDGETINAVLWYSDMRNSTSLASEMAPEQFHELLNSYFEVTAGSVLDHGGEVLRFIGDAVLAIFPIEGSNGEARACRMAMSAAKSAFQRREAYNSSSEKIRDVEFGLGLHIGDVLYGNIGVPERLEFSVIGRAANEVARMEDYTKEVEATVVASSRFVNHVSSEKWKDHNLKEFRGVGRALHVYSLMN
ncbi:MAG: adenylate/guanylate cyclase domain-containing protein [Alphaproteobacteria bacterium]|nr:adenylate/guanylate cyclase domain-containing protein [Alphaproteobacteria bacterium]